MRRVGFVVLVVFLLVPGVASAASYTVNTTGDSNDGSCTAQKCSLRDALTAVNSHPGASDTIAVPPGTYTLGGAELPPITNAAVKLTLTGAGARTTTISGGRKSRVLEIDAGAVAISGLTLTDGSVDATGTANNDGGAGIENLATLSLTDVAVTGNVETGGGDGGGGLLSTGTLTLNRVTVAGNKADADGGGIYVFEGTASIADSTITGNTVDSTLPDAGAAKEFGGGVEFTSGPDTLTNTTIAGNTLNPAGKVGSGGGVEPDSGVVVHAADSIVATDNPTDCGSDLVSAGPNLDGDSTCFTGASDRHGNPLLQPLSDNGGQTNTLALEPGSPAIGHGSSCLAADQRGLARPAGACDLGAYQSTPPIATTGAASALTRIGATLGATVNPDDQFTVAYFQYGTSHFYGSQAPAQAIGSDYAAHPFTQSIGSLHPGTRYHYRIVAINALGATYGTDATFRTPAPPPPAPHFTLGKVSVRGLTFSIPITCQKGATCRGTAALVLHEQTKGKSHTVVAKQVGFTLAGGARKTVTLTLGPTAKGLLKRLHRLTVTVRVRLISGAKTLQTVTRTVTIQSSLRRR